MGASSPHPQPFSRCAGEGSAVGCDWGDDEQALQGVILSLKDLVPGCHGTWWVRNDHKYCVISQRRTRPFDKLRMTRDGVSRTVIMLKRGRPTQIPLALRILHARRRLKAP